MTTRESRKKAILKEKYLYVLVALNTYERQFKRLYPQGRVDDYLISLIRNTKGSIICPVFLRIKWVFTKATNEGLF